jgi:hypothetical protein
MSICRQKVREQRRHTLHIADGEHCTNGRNSARHERDEQGARNCARRADTSADRHNATYCGSGEVQHGKLASLKQSWKADE